jgi:DNA-binding MarR family transcriptional regulator
MRAMSTAGKPPEGRFVDDYLAALLAQASHLVSGEFHKIVTAKGYTVSEWRVLASLAGAQPMSVGSLGRLAVLKQPTVTRVLDRMEPRGQVKRHPHGSDRRITLVAITPSGERQVAGLIELAKEHEHRVLEPFGLARSAELKKTLQQMIELHANLARDAESTEEEEDL